MLAEHGVTYAGEHKHHVLGQKLRAVAAILQRPVQPRTRHRASHERRIAIATDYYASRIEMFPDAPHVLQALRERGLRVGMATSSVSTLALAFLERHKLRDFFDTVVGGEEVEHGKPNPDIYLRAAQKLEAQPSQCLVVEDALAGVQAGKSAGMTVAAIPDPHFADARDYEGKADFILTRLNEVLRVLDELQASRQG
jgi:HAD superfamily hydrolase (TIGR01509 family)